MSKRKQADELGWQPYLKQATRAEPSQQGVNAWDVLLQAARSKQPGQGSSQDPKAASSGPITAAQPQQLTPCCHCERKHPRESLKPCRQCQELFCGVCSVQDYSSQGDGEQVVCVDCMCHPGAQHTHYHHHHTQTMSDMLHQDPPQGQRQHAHGLSYAHAPPAHPLYCAPNPSALYTPV